MHHYMHTQENVNQKEERNSVLHDRTGL